MFESAEIGHKISKAAYREAVPGLRAALLDTGSLILVEHTANDRYWGDGGNGTGQNRLGRLLMELREQLEP